MKFLLTSGGISNNSIRNALVDLLGKPIAECSALYIPTALHANANGPALAEHLGWTTTKINQIARGVRAITPETALSLGEAFGISPVLAECPAGSASLESKARE